MAILSDTAAAAKSYAGLGLSVIPIKAQSKQSLVTWKSYQSEPPSIDQVQAWWDQSPEAGVAIVCGQVSGVLVLDIDTDQKLGSDFPIPPTPMVVTGSGGRHYYFSAPSELYRIPTVNLRSHCNLDGEIRGDGAYVLAPPSVHPSGQCYEWEIPLDEVDLAEPPNWILKLIRRNSAASSSPQPEHTGASIDIDKLPTSPKWRQIIRTGAVPAEYRNDDGSPDRSRRDGAVMGALLRAGVDEAKIKSIFRQYPVGEKVREHSDGDAYIDHTISRAREFIGRNGHSAAQSKSVCEDEATQPDPGRFFAGRTFIPMRLAEELLQEHYIAFAANDFWLYRGGVYRPEGDRVLSREAQRKLGEHTRQNRVREVLYYISTETDTDLPDRPEERFINTRSGGVDWQTGEIREHDPSVFEITQVPVEYDPDVDCPAFRGYLQSALDESLHPLIHEILGYCLIPHTGFGKAVMLTGSGDNGKSVLLDTITALLGDENVAHEPLQNLEHNRFAAAKLVGKLANIFADIPHEKLQRSSMFKTLVTGDRITAEQKHQDPFEFRPYATLLFSANELPATEDKTPAYFKRWLIIPFERQFPPGDPARDPDLRNKLTQPRELSGILNLAIRGLRRLFDQGHFTEPEIVKEAIDDYRRASDTVRTFVDECCVLDVDARVSKARFYEAYTEWCQDNGHHPVSQRTLRERMRQIDAAISEGQPMIAGRQQRAWLGLGLSESER